MASVNRNLLPAFNQTESSQYLSQDQFNTFLNAFTNSLSLMYKPLPSDPILNQTHTPKPSDNSVDCPMTPVKVKASVHVVDEVKFVLSREDKPCKLFSTFHQYYPKDKRYLCALLKQVMEAQRTPETWYHSVKTINEMLSYLETDFKNGRYIQLYVAISQLVPPVTEEVHNVWDALTTIANNSPAQSINDNVGDFYDYIIESYQTVSSYNTLDIVTVMANPDFPKHLSTVIMS